MRVIDADAHMHEPRTLWDDYVEAKYRDRVPKVVAMNGSFMVYEPDGVIIPKGRAEVPPASAFENIEAQYGDAYRDWWSPQSRLRDMDKYGWDIQVLLPTGNNGNFAYRVALQDAALGEAMCRAYNNWAHDYCSQDPSRLKFVAILPGAEPKAMVAEAKRTVEQLGAVSVRNPLLPVGKWLHDSDYDALWNLACDLDFPISVHGEYRDRRAQPFKDLADPNGDEVALSMCGLDHALGFPCDNMATLGHFIFSGLLERFPALRLAILESNTGWLPFWLDRMDNHTHGRNQVMGNAASVARMLPSELFVRQCSISCDSDEKALPYVVDFLGGSNIVWNTDYPHPDAIEPAKALPLLEAQPISEAARQKILWDNAVKLFGNRIISSDAKVN